ncbi:glycosyltransferase family 1 protein, partial [Morganella morganii subsp. sibonii]
YDGIIEKLQKNGGITILFKELTSRIKKFKYYSYDFESHISNVGNSVIKSRPLERYRHFSPSTDGDIFHSTYYRLPTQKNIPIVTTVHDFTYEKFVTGPARWIHSWQKNMAIKNSDKIICISENTANDLLKYCKIPESKIAIVYNGVSEDYHPISESDKTNEIIFIGLRGGYKNFSLAVNAIALSSDFTLTIIGGGILTADEKKMLDTLIPNRYQVLGSITNEELNIALNRAHCLLYPSSYEGFGIPVIEAMKAGCPVIAMNASSIPEIANNSALLLDKLDKYEILSAIKTLEITSERNKFITLGLKNSSQFSWQRCSQETEQVYNTLR